MIRARLLGAGAVCGLAILVVGLAARSLLPLSAAYPWRALAMFVVLLASAQSRVHVHPFPTLGPANRVTLIRLAMVALILGLFGEPVEGSLAGAAVVVGALVAMLDGLDGWLARRSGMVSAFGAKFDVDTDALLILGMSVLVWRYGKADVWVLGIGLMRYAFIAAGLVLPWIARPLTPTLRGKVVAVFQMAALCVALAPFVPRDVSTPVAAVALATLLWSFAADLGRLRRGVTVYE